MNLIQYGNFTLNSGLKSDYKLVADDFIKDNIDGLVKFIRKLGPFGSVYGIPTGGSFLELHLKEYSNSFSSTLLLVDDVLTTGRSMKEAKSKFRNKYEHILGVTVFSRGRCPDWIVPIFQLPPVLW